MDYMTKKEIEERIKTIEQNIDQLVDAVNKLHERLCEIEETKEDMKFEYDFSFGQIKHRN